MAQKQKMSYSGRGKIVSRGIVKAEPREGRPKNPTYLGKRLMRVPRVYFARRPKYYNNFAEVERYEVEGEWGAMHTDPDLLNLNDDEVFSEVSAQDALDKLYAQTIKAFQELGAKLGYDVE